MNTTTKTTVFVLMPKLMKNNHPYRACIVHVNPQTSVLTFVQWVKPVTYHHALPEFLREEFTRANRKLLRPKDIQGLPKIATGTPEKRKVFNV